MSSSFLGRVPLFNSSRRLQPVVSTDEVLPVHLFDNTSHLRSIILVWTFRFDDVLDPDQLYEALSELIRMDGWRRLGGRFRKGVSDSVLPPVGRLWRLRSAPVGPSQQCVPCTDSVLPAYQPNNKLEIHVPQSFTEERPPVHFTKACFDVPMSEHPVATKLPVSRGEVQTFDSTRTCLSVVVGAGHPVKFEDYLCSDLPQFSLHVATFTDGTLVGINHSHMTTDLMGFHALMRAWCLILAGRRQQVPPLIGIGEDGMRPLWDPPARATHQFAGMELRGWRLAYWAVSNLWATWRSGMEARVLCIPKATMEGIMREAGAHLAGSEHVVEGQPPFITRGDVLAALFSRLAAEDEPPAAKRNILTLMALDPRTRIAAFRPDAAYVQNAPTSVFYFCHADHALTQPLGELALMAREAIDSQAQEEQLKAYVWLCVESMRTSGAPVLFGDKNMQLQLMSNWLKADLYNTVDFSPAIVTPAVAQEAAERRGSRGHPTYFHATDPEKAAASYARSLVTICGTDWAGDMWLSVVLPRRIWPKLLAYLARY